MASAMTENLERQILKTNAALIEQYAYILDAPNAPELRNPMDRYNMARLLDNTKRTLAVEAVQTTTAFGANYVPAMLGMIRQVYPRLIASEISSIQPLDRPTGKVFKLDMVRDDLSDPSDYSNWATSSTYANFAGAEGDTITKGMALKITSTDVTLGTPKKLRVSASLELQQDLRAYHNLDPMELLSTAAVDEIQREIDGLLVSAAYTAAAAHKTVTFGTMPGSVGWTADTWRKRLQRAILQADNAIYKGTGRSATFMVCGANAALELMDLNSFTLDGGFAGGNESASFGLERLGTLNGQYKVFRSRYVSDDMILMGRKGSSILDAGLFWLPYVPLYISPRQFNVSNQTEEQSYMSRSAVYVAGNKYFALVDTSGASAGITEA